MRTSILLCTILSGCAFEDANIPRTINLTTNDATMQRYLAAIPVSFVPFSECDGKELGSDMQLRSAMGCFYPKSNSIEVGTVSGGYGSVSFRYQDQIEKTLQHEYKHSLQFLCTGRTWHPVGDGMINSCKQLENH